MPRQRPRSAKAGGSVAWSYTMGFLGKRTVSGAGGQAGPADQTLEGLRRRRSALSARHTCCPLIPRWRGGESEAVHDVNFNNTLHKPGTSQCYCSPRLTGRISRAQQPHAVGSAVSESIERGLKARFEHGLRKGQEESVVLSWGNPGRRLHCNGNSLTCLGCVRLVKGAGG